MVKGILIVEDDSKFRHAIKTAFEGKGYVFWEASSVREALDTLREHNSIQLILLDLELPGGSGIELLKQVADKAANYRVIVLTAHDELLAAEKANEYEVFSYHPKARRFSAQSLIFAVDQAFKDIEREQYKRKIEMDSRIYEQIKANENLKQTLDLICECALEQLGAYTCHFRLSDLKKGDFVLESSKGPFSNTKDIFEDRKRISQFYSGAVAAANEPQYFDDLQNEKPFQEMKRRILASEGVENEVREYLDKVQSAYIVPISTGIFEDEVDAVLNISSDAKGFFQYENRRELIDGFAVQAANAIARYWQKARKQEVHNDYKGLCEMLVEVSDKLKSEGNLNEIYKIVTRKISDTINPEVVSIFRFNKHTHLLENVAEYNAKGEYSSLTDMYDPKTGLTGLVFSKAKTIRFSSRLGRPTPQKDDKIYRAYAQEKIDRIPSGRLDHYLGVPIRIGQNVIGIIRIINKRSQYYNDANLPEGGPHLLRRGFSEDCETELEIAATHLAVAIQNSELIGRLQNLNAIGRKIISVEVDDMLDQIVILAAEFINAEICFLFLKNDRGDGVVLSRTYGMPEINGAFYSIGEGNTGKVAETGISKLEEEADKLHKGKYDEQILEFLRAKYKDESKTIESFIAVPIFGKRQTPFGVIKAINRQGNHSKFDSEDCRLLEIFASQIGMERFAEIQRYRNIISNSPEPIIVLNENGEVKIFSKACEGLWGYSADEVIGSSVVGLYESEQQARDIGKQLWRNTDHRIENLETNIRNKDGELIPISLSATFLFNEEGQKFGSVGVFKDLREMQLLQEQILENEKLEVISLLAKTLVHDIKHDIGIAIYYLEVLLDKSDDRIENETELFNIYQDMHDALWNTIAQLDDVLLAGKSKAPQRKLLSTEDILRLMQGLMPRQANKKGIKFTVEKLADECKLMIDIDQLKRVLWSLFNNSVYAIEEDSGSALSSEPGQINISIKLSDSYVELSWEDNGCGIAEDDLPNIFTPFFTNKEFGSGLGLSIVKKVVENHGGKVSVISKVGKGTRFDIQLPR